MIPFAVGLVGKAGDLPLALDGAPLQRGVIELTKPSQSFVFTGVEERPIPSLNRGFSAPIKLTLPIAADDLRYLAAHDSDPFNRWQAVQSLAMALLTANAAALHAGGSAREDDGLIAALGAILADRKLEPAFIALALAPPSEADVAREIGRDVDPDAIFAARKQLRASIGERLGAALADTYARMVSTAPYRPDADRRRPALAQEHLPRFARGDGARRRHRAAVSQYDNADNMTDRMAALETLALIDGPERAHALEDFYGRYADDPLIIDKWLALQAAIPEPATLDRVRALTKHAAFSMSNPNRVRSLIGSFAQANHTQFNRADGAGYDFVADAVLALDPKNPQVAAPHRRRVPLLARARSRPGARARKRRSSASRRRRRCRATSPTSSRARWRIPKA